MILIIFSETYGLISYFFGYRPESIKKIEFILRSKDNLSIEATWACLFSYRVILNELLLNKENINNIINDIKSTSPHFNEFEALEYLKIHNVENLDLINSVQNDLEYKKYGI